ncbi:hypothetical protein [Homoserinibacter sp. GY 40078]|uniref:hypothetical protein n=1 Tax=Homoserinibacter sp. GY 40078 TaxID=2603275 RepID=UPI0011C6F629|nr:hypothetical protein [Homoserinibacter sp. GY 40078]TXK19577.1 hypothetical protein FVQ89_06805 [Homoserinibacter sp. GY 40078]
MTRWMIVVAKLVSYTLIVAVAVLLSIGLSGSWMPGLPLGVLAGLAGSSGLGLALRRVGRRSDAEVVSAER